MHTARLLALSVIAALLTTGCGTPSAERAAEATAAPATAPSKLASKVTPECKKNDDTGLSGLIDIAWDASSDTAVYKLDDIEIENIDADEPTLKNGKGLIAELKKRQAFADASPDTKGRYKLLIRADKKVKAKFINKALQWGSDAEIDKISFSGFNG